MEISAIKGFRDILPEETGLWQWVESKAREIFHLHGFREIRTPILEYTELFRRSIGKETDIVSKEMYSFQDSKGRSISLRPEATASIVRAYIQNRLYNRSQILKLYTIGPMFRHERPQKGRFRQFHQLNVEILGDPGPISDMEIIVVSMKLMEIFQIKDITLYINSIGCGNCRGLFKRELIGYLKTVKDTLCIDCKRRADSNPLRVFDCKNPDCKNAMDKAPNILHFLCPECKAHLQNLLDMLKENGVEYELNPRLVRGLDYYTRTAFEIQSSSLGAQNAIVGGGRYDGLIKTLGGPEIHAIGFAIGMERLISLISDDLKPALTLPDIFIACLGDRAKRIGTRWMMLLRDNGIRAEMSYSPKNLKAQLRMADKMGAKAAVIVGEDELEKGKVIFRDMKEGNQQEIYMDNLIDNLKEILSGRGNNGSD